MTSLNPSPTPAVTTRRGARKWWLAVGAYAAVVCLFSVIPTDDLPAADLPYLDKAIHLCEYLLFAWILVQAVRASRMPEREYLWWAWIYTTSYGVLMELIQMMVPWRSAEWVDLIANAAGAAIGVWVGQHVPTRAPG